ncbi:hypothetical protein HDU99_007151 [Rhizoclosmatium hyalinum]|nr:hypothetical protein HDU99_007151 [Rhizoclosmatium hyalinum]
MASDVQVSTGWEIMSSGNLVDIIAIQTNETEVNTDPSLMAMLLKRATSTEAVLLHITFSAAMNLQALRIVSNSRIQELYTMDDEYMGSTGEAEKLDNGLWSTTLFDFEVDTFSISTVRIKVLFVQIN